MGYKEIYARYRQQIMAGALKPGDKVPAIRVLAEELKVARKTVEAAYAVLIGEGYLVSQGAKGTRVNPDLVISRREPAEEPAPLADSSLNQLTGLRDNPGEMRLGIPSLDEFPLKKWLLISGKVARSLRPEEMTNQPVTGYAPLREAIAGYLNISRGLDCQPEQVFITSGYRANLRLILQVLAQPSDKVIFEDPGYFFGQKLLKRIAPNLHYAPVDRQGINVDYLLRYHADARFLITTPTHHSPLAVTLSLPRKHQLKSLDHDDRVIYIGTFSKTVMPALRIGYIVMPKETVSRFKELGEITETGLSLLPQKILAQFLSEGHFYKHIKKMRTLYQQRRRLMLDALNRLFPETFSYELSDGGMHIVAFLRRGTQDVALAELWQAQQLQVFSLSAWYTQTQKRYGLIIGYTNIRSEQQAMTLLQRVQQPTLALLQQAN